MDRFADSAGTPWAGRHFEPTPFADDDGSAPPALSAALTAFRSGAADSAAVVDALRGTRLLVPMLAMLGEAAEGPHGRTVDKSADLAVVSVAARDGRTVLPAFTSVAAMAAWNPRARPVPIEAERVALASGAEQDALVILDPGSGTEFGLRRAALRALATGEPYVPCWEHPGVLAAMTRSVDGEDAVVGIDLMPADADARLDGPELLVRLVLVDGLDRAALDALLARLGQRWAGSEDIADAVDGIAVTLARA